MLQFCGRPMGGGSAQRCHAAPILTTYGSEPRTWLL